MLDTNVGKVELGVSAQLEEIEHGFFDLMQQRPAYECGRRIEGARFGESGSLFYATGERPAWRWSGRVVEANGQTVEAEGPLCSVGECCEIVDGDGVRHRAEVIGFRGRHVLAMPLEATQGIRYGDAVLAMG